MYDVIIIGAGTAGLTAAIYARRAGRSALVLEQALPGGQISSTPEVENYPAISHISGADYAQSLHDQAVGLGTEIRYEGVTGAALDGETKRIETAQGASHEGKTVIIANGVRRRTLDIPGEERLTGAGVSYCAVCDGAFHKGKDTVIVGGGNTALEDAVYLSRLCKTVHLVHRRDAFRAGRFLVEAAQARDNIVIHYDTTVAEITGQDKVEGAVLLRKDGSREPVEASGVFIAAGSLPQNALFSQILALDEAGYLVAGEDCRTGLPGVYAAGDTRTKAVRQLVTAAADGAVAALAADAFLEGFEAPLS